MPSEEGDNRLACESLGGRLFERLRSTDAKMHSLLQLMKFDLFRKIVDILSLVKRNLLISPLEGEKKFLSELCELRNFREGYKKYKTLDGATECAMTDVGDKKGKIKMNKNNLQQKQPNNPATFPENKHLRLPDSVFSRFNKCRKTVAGWCKRYY